MGVCRLESGLTNNQTRFPPQGPGIIMKFCIRASNDEGLRPGDANNFCKTRELCCKIFRYLCFKFFSTPFPGAPEAFCGGRGQLPEKGTFSMTNIRIIKKKGQSNISHSVA